MSISLSDFFPKDTEYFYSFPAGEDSNFFNATPAWKEEVISARPLMCAGPHVKVVVFHSAQDGRVKSILEKLGYFLSTSSVVMLPKSIESDVSDKKRNSLVRMALKQVCSSGKLVMAQPFLSQDLENLYQIPPELSVWLNDKKNMTELILNRYLPRRFNEFKDGMEFAKYAGEFMFPCVVKVSSSGAGEGVRICKAADDIQQAQREFSKIKGLIFAEEFIDAKYNVGIQFGIPFDKTKPIQIIGVNQQLISVKGEYVGSIIDNKNKIHELGSVYNMLLNDILPKIRNRGWYGVGGFDVLIKEDGSFYFIDGNLRMTAMSTYLLKNYNGDFKKSLLTFTGSIAGDERGFVEKMLPLAKLDSENQIIYIIALTRSADAFYFNAGILFEDQDDLVTKINQLADLGIKSRVLSSFKQSGGLKNL